MDDLVQEGCIGLVEAIDRYDPERGAGFEAYARFRIRRSMRNALTAQPRSIRLPKYVIERRRALARAEAVLLAGGKRVTALDLARATGLPLDAVEEARTVGQPPRSLDEPAAPGGSPLETLIAGSTADPVAEALSHEEAAALRRAVAGLPERQRRIVNARWGLDGEPAATAPTLAGELGMSPRRMQAIGRDALETLRRELGARQSPS
jgi:RNA polymerase sigma factor (sigma-70 family)